MSDPRLQDLDPFAPIYGRRYPDDGLVTRCVVSLTMTRKGSVSPAYSRDAPHDIVAYRDGEYITIPDDWPPPTKITIRDLTRFLREGNSPALHQLAFEIERDGLDCVDVLSAINDRDSWLTASYRQRQRFRPHPGL